MPSREISSVAHCQAARQAAKRKGRRNSKALDNSDDHFNTNTSGCEGKQVACAPPPGLSKSVQVAQQMRPCRVGQRLPEGHGSSDPRRNRQPQDTSNASRKGYLPAQYDPSTGTSSSTNLPLEDTGLQTLGGVSSVEPVANCRHEAHNGAPTSRRKGRSGRGRRRGKQADYEAS